MRRIFAVTFLFGATLAVPGFAQSTPPADQQGTMPSSHASQSPQTMAPTQGSAATADLMGQTIYSVKDRKIGTITSVNTDVQGQQAALVSIQRYMGMDGQTVLIPVRALQARESGGYTTTLSATELKALSTLGKTSTP